MDRSKRIIGSWRSWMSYDNYRAVEFRALRVDCRYEDRKALTDDPRRARVVFTETAQTRDARTQERPLDRPLRRGRTGIHLPGRGASRVWPRARELAPRRARLRRREEAP